MFFFNCKLILYSSFFESLGAVSYGGMNTVRDGGKGSSPLQPQLIIQYKEKRDGRDETM